MSYGPNTLKYYLKLFLENHNIRDRECIIEIELLCDDFQEQFDKLTERCDKLEEITKDFEDRLDRLENPSEYDALMLSGLAGRRSK